ncbi:MAG: hypothetical protein Q8Q33_07130 [Chlamydiota bacterium]|nr:hypothetical protein [Chlamydiota bacterium]
MVINRRVLLLVLVLALIYLFSIPEFWPQPKCQILMPDKHALSQDLPVPILIQAWHSNVNIAEIRFYPDNHTSEAIDKKPFYPVILYRKENKKDWKYWDVNTLSWPQEKSITIDLPFSEWAKDHTLKSGLLIGTLDITLNYPIVRRSSYYPGLGYRAQETTKRHPFQIILSDDSQDNPILS